MKPIPPGCSTVPRANTTSTSGQGAAVADGAARLSGVASSTLAAARKRASRRAVMRRPGGSCRARCPVGRDCVVASTVAAGGDVRTSPTDRRARRGRGSVGVRRRSSRRSRDRSVDTFGPLVSRAAVVAASPSIRSGSGSRMGRLSSDRCTRPLAQARIGGAISRGSARSAVRRSRCGRIRVRDEDRRDEQCEPDERERCPHPRSDRSVWVWPVRAVAPFRHRRAFRATEHRLCGVSPNRAPSLSFRDNYPVRSGTRGSRNRTVGRSPTRRAGCRRRGRRRGR